MGKFRRLGVAIAALALLIVFTAQIGGGATVTGNPVTGNCAKWTGLTSIGDSGGTCGSGGSGTVTSVSVTTANGVSGTVATATTTPAISLTLGAITPTSAAIGGGTVISSSGPGGALTGAAYATYTSAGNWTPTDGSGASLTFTGVSAGYTQIGNMVFAYATLTYPSTASATPMQINGLPVTVANQNYAQQCTVSFSNSATAPVHALVAKGGSNVIVYTGAGVQLTNAQLSTTLLNFMCVYPVT